MRQMLLFTLEELGYEVSEAENGIEAIEKYAEIRPDCVTLDIVMPRLNGIETVKRIMEFDRNAKIIMVTALGQESFVLDAIKNGAREFIIKPFKNQEIVKAVMKTVGNR